jgi:pimeloyl-ACP methyl ester carboxylesterase
MRIETDGVGVEVFVDGDPAAPPVLLLHGWPDSHDLWRDQIPALLAAGYRVIAPDLRGLGASDRPEEVDAYNLVFLLADVVGVLDQLDIERTHVVGHDWGAALAWALAAFVPARVDHLVALSVGHPASFTAAGFPQREKSWYMLLFQFEGIAEQWLSADDWANLRAWSNHPGLDTVLPLLERPGALTASLNLYRANAAPSALVAPAIEFPAVEAPTMGIWGTEEFALTEQQMTGSAAFVTGPWRYERIEGHSHWLTLEVPARINELLLDFLPAPS